MNRPYRIWIVLMIAVTIWGTNLWLCGTQTSAEPCGVVSRYPGVCLDPGHGGPGACEWNPPCVNGDGLGCCGLKRGSDPETCLTEAWVNHEIVPLAMDALDEWGVYVASTRETITQQPSLSDRCYRANNDPNVDVFISVHHEGRSDVYETRTFYANTGANPTSQWKYKLAQALSDGINDWFQYGEQVLPDDHRGGSYFVLRNTWMPGALTEASSLGHFDEVDSMAFSLAHRRAEANGIRDGLFYYDWDTAPMFLTCSDLWPFPGLEFSWWPVEGADGYVVYVVLATT